MTQPKRTRSEGALARLKKQLQDGTKTAKKSNKKIELTDKDVKRIKREISSLESKLAA